MPETPGTPSDLEGARKGMRKRMPCKRFADDSDPILNKKPKKSITTQSSTGSITSLRTSTTKSAESADVTAPDSPPCTQPHIQPHAPKDAGGNLEDTSEPEPIDVTDSDSSVELIKDDSDELGGHHIWLRNCKLIDL
jgi:hypothetical protein